MGNILKLLLVLILTSCKSTIIYKDNARYYKNSYTVENLINYNLYCSANTCKLVFVINHVNDVVMATKVVLILDGNVINMSYDNTNKYFYTYITQEPNSEFNIKSIYLYYIDKDVNDKLYRIHDPHFLNKNIKNIL